jgi:hypothetical protein
MTHHLVGMAEIAEMLGVTRQRVAQLIESYDDFPAPEVELTAGRIWSRTAIETWIAAHPDRGSGRREKAKKGRVRFERFTDRARRSVVNAQQEARLLNHNYIGTEHLLLGLLAIREGLAFEVLDRLGIEIDAVRDTIKKMIGEGSEQPKGHIPFTPRGKKVLAIALREALALSHNYIGTEHVLLALIREKEGVAWQALAELGLKPKSAREAVLAAIQGVVPPSEEVDLAAELLNFELRLKRLEEREED